MGVDETGTLAALRGHRAELIDALIAEHGGRIVKTMGDGLLLEFPSVVEAVTCAIEIQVGMASRNVPVSEDERIVLRIGVNQGDVIIEGEDIHGDGVNLAARLQEIAEPGGVALSRRVHEDVRDRLDANFEDAGEQTLKNMARPVHVWRWTAAATAGDRAPPLPDKPSIAVLPFDNLSGDAEQEYFSDGITDDIITDLSKISGLFVIARHSSFAYKAKAVDARRAGRELGVRYILEGSVRRAGGKVRINAQLIEAASGNHLWAERYDGDLEDIFALQDRITESIVATLAVSLTRAEQDRALRKEASDLRAYDYVLRGIAYHHRMNKDDNDKARELFERAVVLDPDYAPAYAELAWSLLHDANQGWGADPETSFELALEHAQRAVRLDDGLAKAHMVLGDVYCWMRRHDQAITEGRTAVTLDPSYAEGHMAFGYYLVTSGQAEEAVEEAQKALRFNPLHAHQIYYSVLGQSYYMTMQYEMAMAVLEQGVSRYPSRMPLRVWLAATYAQLGQMDEARRHAGELLKHRPGFSIRRHTHVLPYKNKGDVDHLADGLRKAGLPE